MGSQHTILLIFLAFTAAGTIEGFSSCLSTEAGWILAFWQRRYREFDHFKVYIRKSQRVWWSCGSHSPVFPDFDCPKIPPPPTAPRAIDEHPAVMWLWYLSSQPGRDREHSFANLLVWFHAYSIFVFVFSGSPPCWTKWPKISFALTHSIAKIFWEEQKWPFWFIEHDGQLTATSLTPSSLCF